ncbi:RNA-dependent RNA polymerase [Fusarium poae mitovirus 5]|nr:RNA-dependent RNA polymerase [Fusarium poae mitovirus 5]
MLRNQIKIIKRLCSIFFQDAFQPQHFTKLLFLYSHLIKHHGYVGAIKYMKNMRLHCTRFICGHPLLTNSNSIGLDKDGWPIKLDFLKKSAMDGKLSYVLTILMFNRSIDLPKQEVKKQMRNLSLSTITDGSKCKYTIPTGFIKEFVNKFSLKIKPEEMELSPPDFYLSNKAGPQGKATLTAHRCWLSYSESFIDSLNKLAIGEFAKDWLRKSKKFWFINNKEDLLKTPFNSNQGKLSVVKDPEGKFRIIAIVDYYTQLLLKKLHLAQFKLIKNLPCDRSFTQDPRHHWDSNSESYWSLDLSAATDRFPRILQFRLIGEMYNYNFAKAWTEHLSSLKFSSPNGEVIQYKTGQPMGTYSSWISFTLTHHLLVHWCAKLEGFWEFWSIYNSRWWYCYKKRYIAKRYIKIIKLLGVDISLSKTHVSKDTYEFAKRWFKSGVEITGLPRRGIISILESPNIVFTIVYDFYKIKKNIYTSSYSLVGSMSKLYSSFYMIGKNNKNITRKLLFDLIKEFEIVYWILIQFWTEALVMKMTKVYDNSSQENYILMKSIGYQLQLNLKYDYWNWSKTKDCRTNFYSWYLKAAFNKMDFKVNDPFRGAHIKLHLVWPLYNGVRNEVQHLYKEYNRKIDNNNMSIYDYVSEVRIIDFNGIYEKQRQKYATLLTIGSTMNKGFSEVNKYMESNKGNPLMGTNLYFINILANAHFDMKWDSQKKKFNEGWNPPSLMMNLT